MVQGMTAAPSAVRGPRVVPVDLAALDALEGESLALFLWSNVKPLAGVTGYIDWRLCGALSQALQNGVFRADEGDVLLLPVSGRFGPRRLFLFGLGVFSPAMLTDTTVFRRVGRKAHDVLRRAGAKQIVMAAPMPRRHPEMEATFISALTAEVPQDVQQVLVQKLI
jgi:hypothetical protein